MFYSRRSFPLSVLLAAVLVCTLSVIWGARVAMAQGLEAVAHAGNSPASRVMTLEPLPAEEQAAQSLLRDPKMPGEVPDGFREFGTARAGEIVDTKSLTLRFAAAAKVMKIESTPDFKVEQGGSCAEGYSYAANSTCTLLVRFTPQGPGRRTGQIAVTNSADLKPLYVGLGGNGYAPTISFTPSLITTVPGTSVSGAGILSGATSLAVDGGDSLYIADTGNNKIDVIDSSGTIQNATSSFGATAPISVVVDHNGFTYFTERAQYYFLFILPTPNTETYFYAGTNNCSVGSTCTLNATSISYAYLGALAADPNGNIFLNTFESAARLVPSPSIFSMDYIPLDTPYNYNAYNATAPLPLAVDSSDTLYTYYNDGGGAQCVITGESYYNAESNVFNPVTVVGGKLCGFSGDGGQARSAEIGRQVGQMTFDIAGNLYFTDMLNQRVRRVDNTTGIITTIAGNGVAGYYGDNGPATLAALDNPTGVAVDSLGQVYVISSSATTGTAQVVRKVGSVGALNLGQITVGSSSTVQTVTVANTGNANLDFTHVGFSSGNTTDFTMDVNTTSCNFTVPLGPGHSCKIGFIFTPAATGNRSAVLSMTDDTVTNLNTIQLTGTGYTSATLAPASFSFANTTLGSTSASQTATLTNTGKAILTISSIAFSGTGATSYADTTTCGTALAIGANCTISVTFKPTTGAALPATLAITDNAYPGQQTIALTGTGVAAVLSSASLTFPATELGATSAAQTVKLTNTANVAIAFDSYYYPSDFPTTNNCPTSIPAGGSCTITISYKPATLGARSTSLTVETSTGNVTVALNGTGVAAILSPASLTFPATAVGATSAAQTIKVSNTAGTALGISSFSDTTDFPFTDNCGTSIPAGGSCTISVSFKPATTNARSVVLTVYTSNGNVTATLNGTGTAAAVKKATVTLSVRESPTYDHQTVLLSVQVKSGSSLLPIGDVQLWEGSHMWAQKDLSGGAALFELGELSVGTHELNAVYLSDSQDTNSRSANVKVVVLPLGVTASGESGTTVAAAVHYGDVAR